jgi:hypothetical protein
MAVDIEVGLFRIKTCGIGRKIIPLGKLVQLFISDNNPSLIEFRFVVIDYFTWGQSHLDGLCQNLIDFLIFSPKLFGIWGQFSLSLTEHIGKSSLAWGCNDITSLNHNIFMA